MERCESLITILVRGKKQVAYFLLISFTTCLFVLLSFGCSNHDLSKEDELRAGISNIRGSYNELENKVNDLQEQVSYVEDEDREAIDDIENCVRDVRSSMQDLEQSISRAEKN